MIGFQSDLHKNRIWADSLNKAFVNWMLPNAAYISSSLGFETKPFSLIHSLSSR